MRLLDLRWTQRSLARARQKSLTDPKAELYTTAILHSFEHSLLWNRRCGCCFLRTRPQFKCTFEEARGTLCNRTFIPFLHGVKILDCGKAALRGVFCLRRCLAEMLRLIS